MLIERAFSAPSKLFISGEYAVLWGGTARIAAVSPRGHSLVRGRQDRQVHIALEEGRLRGDATPLGVHWRGKVSAPFRFVAQALGEIVKARGLEALGMDLALSPSAFSPSGQKLGMGGSARATVLAVESARFIFEEKFDPLKLAIFVHVAAQEFKGSGGDVAAVCLGGVIRYRRYPVEPLANASASGQLLRVVEESRPVDAIRLPVPKLYLTYASSEASASTAALISVVGKRLSEKMQAEFVRSSDELGRAIEDAMVRADFGTFCRAVGELERLLAGIGPVETEAIRRILAIARHCGSAGKISGAGGGDGCVLFSSDPEAREALLSALERGGYWATALEVEEGLRGEANPDVILQQWLRA